MNECCISIALYCVLFLDFSLQWKRCLVLISRRLQCFWSERVINRQLGSHRSGTEHTLWVCIFLSATVFSAAPCLAPLSWFIQDFQFSRDASQYLILCVYGLQTKHWGDGKTGRGSEHFLFALGVSSGQTPEGVVPKKGLRVEYSSADPVNCNYVCVCVL